MGTAKRDASKPGAWLLVGGATLALLGCNSLIGNDPWTLEADGGAWDGAWVVAADSGTPTLDSGLSRGDSAQPTQPTQPSQPPSIDSGPADTGLSPYLVLPPASGASCDPAIVYPENDCSQGETCRISGVDQGRCDSYTVDAINGTSCTVDEDCDESLQCYNGLCENLCDLGELCAGGCGCVDIGNETTGLCCSGDLGG